MAEGERFAGFPEAGMQFLLELQAEQSRTWFKAHQADFVRLCRRPLELFVYELKERLADVYPGLAEVEPHFFRIQRDTRFVRDAEPYKTNVSADLPLHAVPAGAEHHGRPGLYVSFGLDEEVIAIGCWHMAPELLAQYRAAVDDPKRGAELQCIVEALAAGDFRLSAMESLKRVPPPFAQDHPRGELLKRKGLAASVCPPDGLAASPALVDWSVDHLTQAAPLVRWLEQALFPAASPVAALKSPRGD
jgi:uncharacterized protein (TIGR02453 family)